MSKPTVTYCENCGHEASSSSEYCPSCGSENPWVTEPKYDMDDVDFPVIIEYEFYDDNYGLWRKFTDQVFDVYEIQASQIANVPDSLPRMKYACPIVYWVVYEDRLDGPYHDESAALESIEE